MIHMDVTNRSVSIVHDLHRLQPEGTSDAVDILDERNSSRSVESHASSSLKKAIGTEFTLCCGSSVLLESRRLLSAKTWTGNGEDLNWNNTANWSGNATPGQQDDVTIGNLGGGTIIVSGTAVDIHSLNSNNPIEVTNTSMTLESRFQSQCDLPGRRWWNTGSQRRHSSTVRRDYEQWFVDGRSGSRG